VLVAYRNTALTKAFSVTGARYAICQYQKKVKAQSYKPVGGKGKRITPKTPRITPKAVRLER